jgi:hypothetical protein
VPSGHEAAVSEECHARDLGLGRALHDSRHVHILRIPQPDRVVEAARDKLRVVRDTLPVLLAQPLRVQRDKLKDGALVPRDVGLLLTPLDAEDTDTEIRMD